MKKNFDEKKENQEDQEDVNEIKKIKKCTEEEFSKLNFSNNSDNSVTFLQHRSFKNIKKKSILLFTMENNIDNLNDDKIM